MKYNNLVNLLRANTILQAILFDIAILAKCLAWPEQCAYDLQMFFNKMWRWQKQKMKIYYMNCATKASKKS